MNVYVPIKCKICGRIIKPPDEALIVGQDPRTVHARMIMRLAAHMEENGVAEMRNGRPDKPHYQASLNMAAAGRSMSGIVMGSYFDLSPELAEIHDAERARLNVLTRKAQTTDDDLRKIALDVVPNTVANAVLEAVEAALRKLRDRYEEIGEHAPKQGELTKA